MNLPLLLMAFFFMQTFMKKQSNISIEQITQLLSCFNTNQNGDFSWQTLLSNPAIIEMVQQAMQNFTQKPREPTSKEFFKPIEKVAGNEISQKLYEIYDNWYIKK